MAFERRQPSVDLRAFLDPLKPGRYFDCGGARLYGIDEALEAEALRRGRAVGDDEFQLVATDGGLIFCRASIMFAIAARWKDLTIGRPEDGNRPGEVLLPIRWPTHGDLQFTVSRRLGSNVFRRWLQLQARATRRSQLEQDVRFERLPPPRETETDDRPSTVDLRDGDSRDRESDDHPEARGDLELESARRPNGNGNGSTSAGTMVDPLATIDAAVVDEWVDDRVPHSSEPAPAAPGSPGRPPAPSRGPIAAFFDEDATADPFNGHEFDEIGVDGPTRGSEEDPGTGKAIRFGVRPVVRESDVSSETGDEDATATRFMKRTLDGTEIFPGEAEGLGRSVEIGNGDETGETQAGSSRRHRNGYVAVPVPEIRGARLQVSEPVGSGAGPRLDIRSTLLGDRRESHWIEMLRRRQTLILGLATIVALGLIALIGFFAGGGGDGDGTVAGVPLTADSGADVGAATVGSDVVGGDQATAGSSITVTVPPGESDPATIDATAPTLRVSSTSVQICHSNYGGCVPVAADVDCEGDGDGPAFQAKAVAVFGEDVYELDTDDDRQACEPDQPRLDATGGG